MSVLRGNTFYRRMIESLDCPPANAQGRIKEIQGALKNFVQINPLSFTCVSDFLKTQEMCNRPVDEWPWLLEYVPDQYKTKEISYKAVRRYLFSLQFVPDWFETQQQLKIWHDYWFVSQQQLAVWYTEWYEGYKKRKAQKAKIKEALLPIAWHPDRVMDWYMSGDKKGLWK